MSAHSPFLRSVLRVQVRDRNLGGGRAFGKNAAPRRRRRGSVPGIFKVWRFEVSARNIARRRGGHELAGTDREHFTVVRAPARGIGRASPVAAWLPPGLPGGQGGDDSWQGPCLKPIVEYDWRLRAAAGYAELGMNRESIAELNAIEKPAQDRPEVLQMRLHHLMREKRWASALRVSRKLCRVAPHSTAGYLHAGFCLHELGKTLQAKKFLMKGPSTLLREPIYFYNMGCYDALL